MGNPLSSCLKIRLQICLEDKAHSDYEIEQISNLCKSFAFWFEVQSVHPDDSLMFVNLYYMDNLFLSSNFAVIIQTFIIQNGYLYLGEEKILQEMPDGYRLK